MKKVWRKCTIKLEGAHWITSTQLPCTFDMFTGVESPLSTFASRLRTLEVVKHKQSKWICQVVGLMYV